VLLQRRPCAICPLDLRPELGGRRAWLVHGSPHKVNEYLFEDKPGRTFQRIAVLADCDVLVFGHTHKPWVRVRRRALRQLRAAGKPRDGAPARRLAVPAASADEVNLTIERVEYDAFSVAREMRVVSLPRQARRLARRGGLNPDAGKPAGRRTRRRSSPRRRGSPTAAAWCLVARSDRMLRGDQSSQATLT
jgi:hypothetical protein